MLQLERFRQPEAKYGIHPFWFWNGDMDDAEIIRQIEEMADKGVGGFFICPRQGLKVPYLSDAWFQKVRTAVKKAEELGLEVWLYDEYPYPSGIAGGEVTLLHPEAKHYTLVHKTEKVSGGSSCELELPWGRVLYAKAVPVDSEGGRLWEQAVDITSSVGNYQREPIFQKAGLTAYNQKRFFTYSTVKKLSWTAPEGEWEVHIFLEEEVADFKYYGTYVDPCNEEAMRTFIRLTHDRYAEHLGEFFGKTIKGMFTDEIGLLGRLPWSPKLLEAFRERNGYDLADHMHALLYADDENSAKVRYDFFQTIHLLIRKAYHQQVYEWCEKHGLQYVAEVPSVRMNTQRFSHVPGGDSGHEKLGRSLDWILNRYAYSLRYNPKMTSSIANQLARERALVECFHSVGWSMTLQDAKWMIDRLAALGVNFFNFHAFFYTLDGLTKHDAPPSQFLQNPYWRYFEQLGSYVRRISYLMSSGRPVRKIAVLDPTTTFWTHLGNPFHEFGYAGVDEEEKQKLESLKEEWRELCKALTLRQRDFDHLDPEILMEAEIVDGELRIGHAAYSVVVIPPITNLEIGAWQKLKQFLAKGGKVIACSTLPSESLDGTDTVQREMAAEFGGAPLTEHAYTVHECGELLQVLDEVLPEKVRFQVSDRSSFLLQQREFEDGASCVFISNQESGEHEAQLIWADAAVKPGDVFRLSLEDGSMEPLAVEDMGDGKGISIFFGPYESHLIYVRRSEAGVDGGSAEVGAPWLWEIKKEGEWRRKPEQLNVLRMDHFELRAGRVDGDLPESGAKVQVKTFIDQLADISDDQQVPLAFSQIFGTPMKMQAAYPLQAMYTASFVVDHIPNVCYLLMDRGAISGDWEICLNGNRILPQHMEETFVYDYMNRRVDIRSYLQSGINTMHVRVKLEHDWDGVVDALYVIGDFAVCTEDRLPALTQAMEYGPLTSDRIEGYPYYAGTILYKKTFEISELPDAEKFVLRFADWSPDFHDSAEVIVNGHSLGARPWTPYEWQGSTDLLRSGANEVEVRVTTTLIGLLEGRRFDYQTHTLLPAVGRGE